MKHSETIIYNLYNKTNTFKIVRVKNLDRNHIVLSVFSKERLGYKVIEEREFDTSNYDIINKVLYTMINISKNIHL